MLTLDRPGSKKVTVTINDQPREIADAKEVASVVTKNPKYQCEGTTASIYVVPDQHMHERKVLDIGEAKSRSGRKGRKIKKSDAPVIAVAIEETKSSLIPEDINGYLNSFLNRSMTNPTPERVDAAKHLVSMASAPPKKGIFTDMMEFHDLDTSAGDGFLQPLPLKMRNLSRDKIDMMRHGKTVIYKNGDEVKTHKGNVLGEVEDEIKKLRAASLAKPGDQALKARAVGLSAEFIEYEPTGEEMIEICYIYGPNGSGKTYYAANYTKEWKKTFTDWPIFLFSRRDSDRVLDEIPDLKRIAIDQTLVQQPLTMTDFACSLVIFDDIDTITDASICRAVQKLRDDIMETGRQKMIYVINTSHLGMNWKPTRTVLNEANSYTIFPRKGNYEQNFKILQNKVGLKSDVVRAIVDKSTTNMGPEGSLSQRGKWGWITIHKDSPQYIIYEKGVAIV